MEEEVLRVRFLTGMAGRGFAYVPGQEVVLKRAEAHRLIQNNVCEPILATELDLPIVPCLVEGAYEAWPRGRRWPRPGRISVTYGVPLHPAELAAGASSRDDAYRRVADGLRAALLELGAPPSKRDASH